MPNYQDGKIYKIIDNTSGLTYFGSTTKKYLSKRLSCHVWECYARPDKGLSIRPIIEGGDYSIHLVENYPTTNKKDLLERERYYIENNTCVNINIPGRTKKDYMNNYYTKRRVICECGLELNAVSMSKHLQRGKHTKLMEKLKINES